MEQAEVVQGLAYLIALVLSVCVHEFGHAWMADRLGDPLPKAQGRPVNKLAARWVDMLAQQLGYIYR
jgi:hypothetical protein